MHHDKRRGGNEAHLEPNSNGTPTEQTNCSKTAKNKMDTAANESKPHSVPALRKKQERNRITMSMSNRGSRPARNTRPAHVPRSYLRWARRRRGRGSHGKINESQSSWALGRELLPPVLAQRG